MNTITQVGPMAGAINGLPFDAALWLTSHVTAQINAYSSVLDHSSTTPLSKQTEYLLRTLEGRKKILAGLSHKQKMPNDTAAVRFYGSVHKGLADFFPNVKTKLPELSDAEEILSQIRMIVAETLDRIDKFTMGGVHMIQFYPQSYFPNYSSTEFQSMLPVNLLDMALLTRVTNHPVAGELTDVWEDLNRIIRTFRIACDPEQQLAPMIAMTGFKGWLREVIVKLIKQLRLTRLFNRLYTFTTYHHQEVGFQLINQQPENPLNAAGELTSAQVAYKRFIKPAQLHHAALLAHLAAHTHVEVVRYSLETKRYEEDPVYHPDHYLFTAKSLFEWAGSFYEEDDMALLWGAHLLLEAEDHLYYGENNDAFKILRRGILMRSLFPEIRDKADKLMELAQRQPSADAIARIRRKPKPKTGLLQI